MCLRSAVLLTALLLAACGEQAPQEPAPEAAAPDAAAPAPDAATSSEAPPPADAASSLPRQPAPEGARVYIVSPQDGEQVENPVRVVFGLAGAGVAPAGVAQPDTGHHHLLIDATLGDHSVPIPADDRHVHFGAGQTETTLELEPGMHTLQLVLGDHLHIPHDPPLTSETISIDVQP